MPIETLSYWIKMESNYMKCLMAISRPSLLLKIWEFMNRLPGGKTLFSKIAGRMAPYTGSINSRVLELQPGRAVVEMRDRRRVRNHLNSIHAMALVNLAEVTSGLAMICGIPDDARGIITAFSIEYKKKARGTIVAKCEFEPPEDNLSKEYDVIVALKDRSGDDVAEAKARWLIGPVINE